MFTQIIIIAQDICELHSYYKIYCKACYNKMKLQRSVFKTVKDADNQRRDNEKIDEIKTKKKKKKKKREKRKNKD